MKPRVSTLEKDAAIKAERKIRINKVLNSLKGISISEAEEVLYQARLQVKEITMV